MLQSFEIIIYFTVQILSVTGKECRAANTFHRITLVLPSHIVAGHKDTLRSKGRPTLPGNGFN